MHAYRYGHASLLFFVLTHCPVGPADLGLFLALCDLVGRSNMYACLWLVTWSLPNLHIAFTVLYVRCISSSCNSSVFLFGSLTYWASSDPLRLDSSLHEQFGRSFKHVCLPSGLSHGPFQICSLISAFVSRVAFHVHWTHRLGGCFFSISRLAQHKLERFDLLILC